MARSSFEPPRTFIASVSGRSSDRRWYGPVLPKERWESLDSATFQSSKRKYRPRKRCKFREVMIPGVGHRNINRDQRGINLEAFTNEFVKRARFTASYPLTMSEEEFVDMLNSNAARPLSQSERDHLVRDLA